MTPRDYRSEVLFATACMEAFADSLTYRHLKHAVVKPSSEAVWCAALSQYMVWRLYQDVFPLYLRLTRFGWIAL